MSDPERKGLEPGLYVVATPIGNLGDVTRRAVEVLRSVDAVYAEDTRRTGVLLRELGVDANLRSFHEHNAARRTEEILERLTEGRSCALVSDAGTPTVSDPGRRVVRRALEEGLRVVPVPGPSAVVAALSVSGLPADRFAFLGFPPRKGAERETWLARLASLPLTVVAFESPRRISDLLQDLVDRGLESRRCVLCRELTKKFEEVRSGTLEDVLGGLDPETARGEITVVLEGAEPGGWEDRRRAVTRDARRLLSEGRSTRDVVRYLRERHGVPRNDAYDLALEVEGEP
jgi:16S rRNA (cytidine1402-2'-O)-methyltransferase